MIYSTTKCIGGHGVHIGGVIVGADTSVGNGWRVGGLAGYSRSDMNNMRSSSIKTDDYTLGAYGGNQWNNTSLRLGASHTWHKDNGVKVTLGMKF